jgi:hypothetical protein
VTTRASASDSADGPGWLIDNDQVPISAVVDDIRGNQHGLVAEPGINSLVDHARAAGIPMLGWIEPYGTTTFNKVQMLLLVPVTSTRRPTCRWPCGPH